LLIASQDAAALRTQRFNHGGEGHNHDCAACSINCKKHALACHKQTLTCCSDAHPFVPPPRAFNPVILTLDHAHAVPLTCCFTHCSLHAALKNALHRCTDRESVSFNDIFVHINQRERFQHNAFVSALNEHDEEPDTLRSHSFCDQSECKSQLHSHRKTKMATKLVQTAHGSMSLSKSHGEIC